MDDVAQARPEILKAVDTMMKKGKFSVPGSLSLPIQPLTCLIDGSCIVCRIQGEVRRPFRVVEGVEVEVVAAAVP